MTTKNNTDAQILDPVMMAYYSEYMEDTKLNELNISERVLEIPGIKAKWWMYFYKEKALLAKLNKLKDTRMEEYITQGMTHPGALLPVIKKNAVNSDLIVQIRTAITARQDIVDFLEGLAKLSAGMGFDITNIINNLKLEG